MNDPQCAVENKQTIIMTHNMVPFCILDIWRHGTTYGAMGHELKKRKANYPRLVSLFAYHGPVARAPPHPPPKKGGELEGFY